ncbi:MAG: GlsB/YeaQ/YmgE family stress response membrane protein [Paraburkholderia hospita]
MIIGCIAGWLASVLVSGSGYGVLLDIVVGIVGAFIGGWLSGALHISRGSGWIGSTITAFIGAVILLFVIRLFRRG